MEGVYPPSLEWNPEYTDCNLESVNGIQNTQTVIWNPSMESKKAVVKENVCQPRYNAYKTGGDDGIAGRENNLPNAVKTLTLYIYLVASAGA